MKKFYELQSKYDSFIGTLVIHGFIVAKLVGIVYYGDDKQYFWVLLCDDGLTIEKIDSKIITLKGSLPDEEYSQLVNLWNKENNNKVT